MIFGVLKVKGQHNFINTLSMMSILGVYVVLPNKKYDTDDAQETL
jgi:hypothetical protein